MDGSTVRQTSSCRSGGKTERRSVQSVKGETVREYIGVFTVMDDEEFFSRNGTDLLLLVVVDTQTAADNVVNRLRQAYGDTKAFTRRV